MHKTEDNPFSITAMSHMHVPPMQWRLNLSATMLFLTNCFKLQPDKIEVQTLYIQNMYTNIIASGLRPIVPVQ